MVRRIVRDYYSTTREFSTNARLFLLATFLTWIGHSVNQVVFNLYLLEGGYAEDFIGGVVAMMGVGMAIMALPAGHLADRFGRRACLLAGSGLTAAALLGRSLTLSPVLLMGTTLLLGAAQALLTIASSPFMSENSFESERTHLFSMHFVVVLLGGIAGNLMGGELPVLLAHVPNVVGSSLSAYRWTLVAGAVVSMIAIWPLLPVRESPPVAQARALRVRARDHAPLLARLALNFLLVGIGAGLIMPFFNLYFARRFGATSSQIGLYFSVAQVITLVATLLGPLVARRFGKLRAVTWLQLASLPFLVTLGLESTLGIAVFAFWMRSAFMQMSSPLLNSFAMDVVPPALRARAHGIDNLGWYLGWAMSSALAGWVIARFGYAYPYYITAFFYGLATITFYWNFRAAGGSAEAPPDAPAGKSAPA
jgi:MFS family permease